MAEPCLLYNYAVNESGSVTRIDRGGATYWRWYCRCGAVGGRRSTPEAARADFARHEEETGNPASWEDLIDW